VGHKVFSINQCNFQTLSEHYYPQNIQNANTFMTKNNLNRIHAVAMKTMHKNKSGQCVHMNHYIVDMVKDEILQLETNQKTTYKINFFSEKILIGSYNRFIYIRWSTQMHTTILFISSGVHKFHILQIISFSYHL
jgi:hypothetical protein